MFTFAKGRELLAAGGLFFDQDYGVLVQCLNLNDTFYWACADGEEIPDSEIQKVAELFYRWGWCGVLYWVWKRRGGDFTVEFQDIHRFIEFVTNEESIREKEPSDSKRAYFKYSYIVGGNVDPKDEV